jgi:hypothetical protein
MTAVSHNKKEETHFAFSLSHSLSPSLPRFLTPQTFPSLSLPLFVKHSLSFSPNYFSVSPSPWHSPSLPPFPLSLSAISFHPHALSRFLPPSLTLSPQARLHSFPWKFFFFFFFHSTPKLNFYPPTIFLKSHHETTKKNIKTKLERSTFIAINEPAECRSNKLLSDLKFWHFITMKCQRDHFFSNSFSASFWIQHQNSIFIHRHFFEIASWDDEKKHKNKTKAINFYCQNEPTECRSNKLLSDLKFWHFIIMKCQRDRFFSEFFPWKKHSEFFEATQIQKNKMTFLQIFHFCLEQ